MILQDLIKIAFTLALAAVLSGQAPKITRAVLRTQAELLENSKTHTWGTPVFRLKQYRPPPASK